MSLPILLGYMGMITVASSIPDVGVGRIFLTVVPDVVSSLLHLPGYGLLALLWAVTFETYGLSRRWSVLSALILTSGYGALAEFSQRWVSGRYPSAGDFLLDVAGIVLFLGLYGTLNPHGSPLTVRRSVHTQRPDDTPCQGSPYWKK